MDVCRQRIADEEQSLLGNDREVFGDEGILIGSISVWRTPEEDRTLQSWTRIADLPLEC